jgi:hypothetical protein
VVPTGATSPFTRIRSFRAPGRDTSTRLSIVRVPRSTTCGGLWGSGFGVQQRPWRAAERRHCTGRERMRSPTLQTGADTSRPNLAAALGCFLPVKGWFGVASPYLEVGDGRSLTTRFLRARQEGSELEEHLIEPPRGDLQPVCILLQPLGRLGAVCFAMHAVLVDHVGRESRVTHSPGNSHLCSRVFGLGGTCISMPMCHPRMGDTRPGRLNIPPPAPPRTRGCCA